MARSLWSGAISFGLVNVPVKLFSAVSRKEVRFNMLHEKDGGRIQQKRVCSVDGEEVPWEEIAKGWEVRRGRFVMLTKDELHALDPAASRAIEIEDFVGLDEIDPIYYEHTYYAAPDDGAERPYGLLLEAMKRTKKVAIARIVMRTKQYLCAIRPMEGDVLALSTMSYADEVVPAKSLGIAKLAKISDRELDMAERLVESLSTDFAPDRYKDEHRERLLEVLQRKAEGEEIVAPEAEERRPEVVNLADALEMSLAAARGRKENGAKREPFPEDVAAHHAVGGLRPPTTPRETTDKPGGKRARKGARSRTSRRAKRRGR